MNSRLCYKGNYWNEEEDIRESERIAEEYKDFIGKSKQHLKLVERYFNSRLHDSWVIGIEVEKLNIRIMLNDFMAHCFSDALEDTLKLGTKHRDRKFPVELIIEGVKYWNLFGLNRNGKMLPLSKDRYLKTLHEFLYDELKIISEEEVFGGLLFSSDSYRSSILFEFRAEGIGFVEGQEKAFTEIFGHENIKYWEHFWKKRCDGEHFDYSMSIEEIKRLKQ